MYPMNDFEYQLGFVIDASWRMMEMQDRNPLSPSHGCFHYSYWRDKTSEFSDARFQEAGAALALLSLPRFDDYRSRNGLLPSGVLYGGFSAALRYWATSQYDEGCWDEWYKGERGFAATEFTMIAYGLAAHYLEERIEPADRNILSETMRKAGDWLVSRHDTVKANHEAAAGAALALAWEVTGEARFREAAREKIEHTLSRQTREGWFPEVGGMDLGYCSVLLDYIMIYVLITGDDLPVTAMRKLAAFMLPHLHPDATISPEAGLCLNPYVSRIGMGLLSAHGDANAAAVIASLDQVSPGREALAAYLADDLRLLRWSYLPLVTEIERPSFHHPPDIDKAPLARAYPGGWTIRESSAIAAFHDGDLHIYVSIAGGGAVRIYSGRSLICEDIGIHLVTDDGNWGSAGYATNREILRSSSGVGFKTALGKAAFFYPGLLSRMILRVGCTTAWSSRLLRQAIDRYRTLKGTAINQSAAPIASEGGGYLFERTVDVSSDAIIVRDRLSSKNSPIDSDSLCFNLSVYGDAWPVRISPFRAAALTATKTMKINDEDHEFSVDIQPE